MDFNWKSIVKAVAPALGTALGGPVGGLAVTALTSVLGIEPDSTEDQIAAAVRTATPEQLLALKNADNQFKIDMERLHINLKEIEYKDRDSARQREIGTSGASRWATPILAGLVLSGFFWSVWWVFSNGISDMTAASAAFVGTMVGYVSAKADQVVSYYFGSSAGSEGKNALLAGIQGAKK
jgi:hypothetical protein